MKTIILTFILSIFMLISFSQTINDIPIKTIDVEYIRIVGTEKLFSTKVTITIDFGQNTKFFTSKDYRIKDKEGRTKKFNSMIDALNFMYKNGYEFIAAYTLTVGNSNVYHYLMKKKKK